MNRTTTFVLASAGLLFAACADSEPKPQLSAAEYDEVAQSLGGAVVMSSGGGELGAVSDSVAIALGDVPLGFRVSGSGQIEGQHGGLEYRYQVTCRDAAGQELPACNDTTDRAGVTVAWSGQLELPRFRIASERNGAWTLSELQSETAAFAGTSDFHVNVATEPHQGPALRTYDLSYTAEYEGIEVDVAAGRITAGRAHLAVAAERTQTGNGQDQELTFEVDAVLTFDGDNTATLVIDGTHTFEIDLNSGRVSRR